MGYMARGERKLLWSWIVPLRFTEDRAMPLMIVRYTHLKIVTLRFTGGRHDVP